MDSVKPSELLRQHDAVRRIALGLASAGLAALMLFALLTLAHFVFGLPLHLGPGDASADEDLITTILKIGVFGSAGAAGVGLVMLYWLPER